MRKFIVSLLIGGFLFTTVGCSTLREAWEENRTKILKSVVKVLEEEKVEDRVIDQAIAALESEIAAVDSGD